MARRLWWNFNGCLPPSFFPTLVPFFLPFLLPFPSIYNNQSFFHVFLNFLPWFPSIFLRLVSLLSYLAISFCLPFIFYSDSMTSTSALSLSFLTLIRNLSILCSMCRWLLSTCISTRLLHRRRWWNQREWWWYVI